MTLREYAKTLGLDVGCGDSSCAWGPTGGMMTNGGCQCVKYAGNAQTVGAMRRVAEALLKDRDAMHPVWIAAQAWHHGAVPDSEISDAVDEAEEKFSALSRAALYPKGRGVGL